MLQCLKTTGGVSVQLVAQRLRERSPEGRPRQLPVAGLLPRRLVRCNWSDPDVADPQRVIVAEPLREVTGAGMTIKAFLASPRPKRGPTLDEYIRDLPARPRSNPLLRREIWSDRDLKGPGQELSLPPLGSQSPTLVRIRDSRGRCGLSESLHQ